MRPGGYCTDVLSRYLITRVVASCSLMPFGVISISRPNPCCNLGTTAGASLHAMQKGRVDDMNCAHLKPQHFTR